MRGFQRSEQIRRAPREVFAVIADPTVAPKFVDGITASRKVTDGPVGAGTVFQETRVVNGSESSAELVVTDYRPDSHFSISSDAEGIRVIYHYHLTAGGDGTIVDWACDLEAGGLRRMMLPLVAAIMKKEDGDHLHRLKNYLESTRHEPPS